MLRAFEWNILHTPQLDRFWIGLDGVVAGADEDTGSVGTHGDHAVSGSREPHLLLRHRVGWLLTGRPEGMRADTMNWLARHGVECGQLIMPAVPRDVRSAVAFKARVYCSTGAELLIEGNPEHAAGIAERAGKPVFCFVTRDMVNPGHFPRYRHIPVRKGESDVDAVDQQQRCFGFQCCDDIEGIRRRKSRLGQCLPSCSEPRADDTVSVREIRISVDKWPLDEHWITRGRMRYLCAAGGERGSRYWNDHRSSL